VGYRWGKAGVDFFMGHSWDTNPQKEAINCRIAQ